MKRISVYLLCMSLLVSISSCNSSKKRTEVESPYAGFEYDLESDEDYVVKIPFSDKGTGVVHIPVTVNGMGVEMIFDTGASSTTISLQEAAYLAKHGKLEEDDILAVQQFSTADGSISEGLVINLKEMLIGGKIKLTNTEAVVVMNQEAPLLLGNTVFSQFREVSVDRQENVVKFYKY